MGEQSGADPTQLQVMYNSQADEIDVTYSSVTIKLTKDKCKKFDEERAAAAPSGQYCGSELGIANAKLTSVDSSHVELDIDVAMLGTHLHCPSEEFQLAPSGAVTLPKDSDPSDCVGGFLEQSGADPTQLQVMYNSQADEIDVTYSSVTIKLTKDKCKKPAQAVAMLV